MLVIISFKYIFKFFMCGHAWVNFRVLTRWKCFTQNTIFKLILKIYEFSLKFMQREYNISVELFPLTLCNLFLVYEHIYFAKGLIIFCAYCFVRIMLLIEFILHFY